MSNIGLIPFTKHVFSSHGDAGSFTWSKEGFGDDPVFTLSFDGPAGKITVAVSDAVEFMAEIADAIIDPDFDATAWISSDRHYIAFKFAKELDVMDLPDGSVYCEEPSSWGRLSDGSFSLSKRGNQNLPAYLVIEVYSVDADAPRGERTQLVAMAGMERHRVEQLLEKIEDETLALAGV